MKRADRGFWPRSSQRVAPRTWEAIATLTSMVLGTRCVITAPFGVAVGFACAAAFCCGEGIAFRRR